MTEVREKTPARLKVIQHGATIVEQFWYDGLNRQITRNVNGTGITFHVWDGWNLIEERGTGGAIFAFDLPL